MSIQPFAPFNIPISTEAFIAKLTWPIQATIEASPQGLYVQVGNLRIPIESQPNLQPGQTVLIELIPQPDGARLQVSPLQQQTQNAPSRQLFQTTNTIPNQPPDSITLQSGSQGITQTNTVSPAPPQPTQDIAQVIRSALDALAAAGNRINIPPETLEPLMPTSMPVTNQTVQNILSLMATQTSLGKELQQVLSLLQETAPVHQVPLPPVIESLILAERALATPDRDFPNTLSQFIRAFSTPVASKIADILGQQEPAAFQRLIQEDLQTQLNQIRENPAILRAMESRGQAEWFVSTVDRIANRIMGNQLQNLWSLNDAYLFVELPFSAESPIRAGRIHILGEGSGKGRHFNDQPVSVVLDLSTSRLGDVWIRLAVAKSQCNCTIMATHENAVAALQAESDTLKTSLEKAGYPNSRVHIATWDGNRLRETLSLLRRFKGINIKA